MTDVPPTPSEDPMAGNPSPAPTETSAAPPPPPPPAPPPPPPAGYAAPQPGAAAPGLYFDQVSGLNIPQGTELATHGRRIGAWFLAIPLSIVTLFIGYIIWGLIIWGRGQTPTQQVLGMRTWVPEGGQRATWGKMALREIVGVGICTSLIFITQIVSFVLFLTGRERKAIADHIASTVILRDPNDVLAQEGAAA